MNRNHIQAEEEVFSEGALAERRLQVTIRSGNDATSMLIFSLLPTGRTSLSCRTRSSWLAIQAGVPDFVEKNSASISGLKQAGLGFYGPVKAPFAYPNRSLSINVGTSAPQSTATTAAARTRPGSGLRAQPILSPFRSRHRSAPGPRILQPADHSQDFTDLGDSPMIPSSCWSVRPVHVKLCSLAQAGFFLHPAKQHPEFLDAERLLDVVIPPDFIASTADSIDPCPVMMTTSVAGRRDLIWRSRSAPDRLGNRRSAMTMSGVTAGLRANAASALSASNRGTKGASHRHAKTRMLCSSSTTRSRMRESSLVICELQDK